MEKSPNENRERGKSKPQGSSPRKVARPRNIWLHVWLPLAAVLIGGVLVAVFAVHIMTMSGTSNVVQDVPISNVLNLADQHKLKSVEINGDDVFATATTGQQYHAVKEDGQ